MGSLSKCFYEATRGKTCRDMLHPGYTCYEAGRIYIRQGVLGAMRHYLPGGATALLFRMNNWDDPEVWKGCLLQYVRCIVAGLPMTAGSFHFFCGFYNLLGRFSAPFFVFIPSLLGACTCMFLPRPIVRAQGIGLFNMAIHRIPHQTSSWTNDGSTPNIETSRNAHLQRFQRCHDARPPISSDRPLLVRKGLQKQRHSLQTPQRQILRPTHHPADQTILLFRPRNLPNQKRPPPNPDAVYPTDQLPPHDGIPLRFRSDRFLRRLQGTLRALQLLADPEDAHHHESAGACHNRWFRERFRVLALPELPAIHLSNHGADRGVLAGVHEISPAKARTGACGGSFADGAASVRLQSRHDVPPAGCLSVLHQSVLL